MDWMVSLDRFRTMLASERLQGRDYWVGLSHGTMRAELFAPRGADTQSPHRFEAFSEDFATWVVFWGPPGGEQED